jgi:hypothetical protein
MKGVTGSLVIIHEHLAYSGNLGNIRDIHDKARVQHKGLDVYLCGGEFVD